MIKRRPLLNNVFGIFAEVFYAFCMMSVAFLICVLINFKK